MKSSPMILVHSLARQFKQFIRIELPWTNEISKYYDPWSYYSVVQAVRLGWTTQNSGNILLQSFFLHLLCSSRSSAGSTNFNLRNILLWCLFSQLLSVLSSSTGLNYTPNSWNVLLWSLFPQLLSSWSSSAGWSNPELMKYCPIILIPSITR